MISELAKVLRALDGQHKPPGVKWPRWRGRRDLRNQYPGSWPVHSAQSTPVANDVIPLVLVAPPGIAMVQHWQRSRLRRYVCISAMNRH